MERFLHIMKADQAVQDAMKIFHITALLFLDYLQVLMVFCQLALGKEQQEQDGRPCPFSIHTTLIPYTSQTHGTKYHDPGMRRRNKDVKHNICIRNMGIYFRPSLSISPFLFASNHASPCNAIRTIAKCISINSCSPPAPPPRSQAGARHECPRTSSSPHRQDHPCPGNAPAAATGTTASA